MYILSVKYVISEHIHLAIVSDIAIDNIFRVLHMYNMYTFAIYALNTPPLAKFPQKMKKKEKAKKRKP